MKSHQVFYSNLLNYCSVTIAGSDVLYSSRFTYLPRSDKFKMLAIHPLCIHHTVAQVFHFIRICRLLRAGGEGTTKKSWRNVTANKRHLHTSSYSLQQGDDFEPHFSLCMRLLGCREGTAALELKNTFSGNPSLPHTFSCRFPKPERDMQQLNYATELLCKE